jgi:predicted metal-dependent HD superfamily phosphohydrolase
MNPSFRALLKAAELKAGLIIETKVGNSYQFHNLRHTRQVVKACEEMAHHYQLNDDDQLSLLIAAWFHDTGYSSGFLNHEKNSIDIAKEFLVQQHTEEAIINKVSGCIAATKMPQQPTSQLEEIICDADLFHLGTETVDELSKALRQENILTKGLRISKTEWARKNIYFMEQHRYFTDYCREKLEPVKQEYVRKLRKKYNMEGEVIILSDTNVYQTEHQMHEQEPIKDKEITTAGSQPKKDKQKDKPQQMLRGVETFALALWQTARRIL